MAITKTTIPYEFLVRWTNGVLSGAHIRMLEIISENGVVLTQKEGNAQPVSLAGEVGFPLADILTSLQAQAIEQRDAAVAALAAGKTEVDSLVQAAKTDADALVKVAQDALTAAQAQVATLQAQIDAYTPPAVAEPVADPEGPSVDDLQIRLALNASGLREAVELAVLGSDQSTKDWWDRASNFKRLNPMVVALGAALGKTDEELDGLWALAATLG